MHNAQLSISWSNGLELGLEKLGGVISGTAANLRFEFSCKFVLVACHPLEYLRSTLLSDFAIGFLGRNNMWF